MAFSPNGVPWGRSTFHCRVRALLVPLLFLGGLGVSGSQLRVVKLTGSETLPCKLLYMAWTLEGAKHPVYITSRTAKAQALNDTVNASRAKSLMYLYVRRAQQFKSQRKLDTTCPAGHPARPSSTSPHYPTGQVVMSTRGHRMTGYVVPCSLDTSR